MKNRGLNQKSLLGWLCVLYLGPKARTSNDEATHLEDLIREANRGNTKAQCTLGRLYEDGEGVAENFAEAVKWYRKAAENDSPRGQYNLGRMYAAGMGVRRNYTQALRWFGRAAAQRYAPAEQRMREMYAGVIRTALSVARHDRLAPALS